MTDDGGGYSDCYAESAGGFAQAAIDFMRDATAPTITIVSPEERTYVVGESAAVDFSCEDGASGMVSCSGSQSGALNTTTAGTFTFTVTALDVAGNTSTQSVQYTVVKITPTSPGIHRRRSRIIDAERERAQRHRGRSRHVSLHAAARHGARCRHPYVVGGVQAY
jgi:hypothetical protein